MDQVQIENFNLIGIAIRTSNVNGKAATDIPGLWQKFISQGILQNIPNKKNDKVYCIYMEYEGDHNMPYTTFIGCEVTSQDELPEGMVAKTIRGGNYQPYEVKGKITEIVIGQWMKIWELI